MTKIFGSLIQWFGSDNRKSAIQNPKLLGLATLVIAFAICGDVGAQPTNVPRIGYFSASTRSNQTAPIEAFLQGLRELGYVEGKNIAIEWRWAESKFDRLPDLAAELLRLKVDIIVSAGPAATRAAKKATTTIPIVMTNEGDPVGTGFVASLARPAGNITGLSTLAPELDGKRLELLKETIPKLSRVAVIGRSAEPGYAQLTKDLDLAAAVLKVKLQHLDLPDPKDTETAFRAASKGRADAVLLVGSPGVYRKQIVDLAVTSQLPAMYYQPEFVEAGGLMFYGVNRNDLYRRAATYVDKILKGAKPADLPVEQPIKFEFIVNLKAAKQIGLTIPPNVLARADKVIK
jgi:putative ABC transport system substrate-binding protein